MKHAHDIGVVDFNPDSIKKAVEKRAINNPLAVYPVAAGFVAAAALFLIDIPMFMAYVAGGFVSFGVGSWAVNRFIRGEQMKLQYTEMLRNMLREQVAKTVIFLEQELEKLGSRQGAEQLSQLKEKFDNLEKVLAMRFSQGELTYGRYLGTAEQVRKGVVDNLKDVVVALQSISTIDAPKLEKRLQKCKVSSDENQKRECVSLEERLTLFKETEDRVEKLLALNEEALTALDNTAVAVSKIEAAGDATMDVEDAMKELIALAKRASQYSA